MTNTDSRRVIIVGGNHHNTLGVIRALGFKGLKDRMYLILHGDKTAFVSKSKFLRKSHIRYIQDESEIPEKIKSITSGLEEKPVVIACGDHYISLIDNNLDNLRNICHLPNAKGIQGRINSFLDKENQDNVAKDNGFSIPDFNIVEIKHLDKYKRLPCIIKPINSVKGAKSDIVICETDEQIDQYIKGHSNNFVRIERFIKKKAEFQLIGCSLHQDIIIPGYTNIIRQPQNTNTGYLVYRPINDGFISPDLLRAVKSFIRKIGYFGLFSVEFLRDDNGNDYFLEINMRNDGNAFCVITAGVNLPYIWYKYCDKGNLQIEETCTFHKEVYWMPEEDFRNVKKVGIIKWIGEWFSADSHGVANMKDPYPLIYKIFKQFF